jgi:hypothetical protein
MSADPIAVAVGEMEVAEGLGVAALPLDCVGCGEGDVPVGVADGDGVTAGALVLESPRLAGSETRSCGALVEGLLGAVFCGAAPACAWLAPASRNEKPPEPFGVGSTPAETPTAPTASAAEEAISAARTGRCLRRFTFRRFRPMTTGSGAVREWRPIRRCPHCSTTAVHPNE